jgi:hypothetical protein
MIYDCFTFFNELELLELRLEELYPVVDYFVIVESDLTFSGKPKPLYLAENLDQFSKYADKMKLVATTADPDVNSWQREYAQRRDIGYGLPNARPTDIIMVSDADEIPRRSVVEKMNKSIPIQAFSLDVFYYGLNSKSTDVHTIRAAQYHKFNELGGAHNVRVTYPETMPITHNAGWHFSYLGDVEHIIKKFQSFSHTELDRPDTNNPEILMQRMRAGNDLWGDGHQYEFVEVDDTWPEAVKNNREKWNKYIWTV